MIVKGEMVELFMYWHAPNGECRPYCTAFLNRYEGIVHIPLEYFSLLPLNVFMFLKELRLGFSWAKKACTEPETNHALAYLNNI